MHFAYGEKITKNSPCKTNNFLHLNWLWNVGLHKILILVYSNLDFHYILAQSSSRYRFNKQSYISIEIIMFNNSLVDGWTRYVLFVRMVEGYSRHFSYVGLCEEVIREKLACITQWSLGLCGYLDINLQIESGGRRRVDCPQGWLFPTTTPVKWPSTLTFFLQNPTPWTGTE